MAGVWDLYIATTHSSIFCRCFYCRLAPKSTDKFLNALFFKSAIFRNSVRMNHGTKVALSLLSCPPPLSYGVTLVAQPSYYGRRARPPHHTKRDNNSPFHSSMMKISPVLIMSISKCLSCTLKLSTFPHVIFLAVRYCYWILQTLTTDLFAPGMMGVQHLTAERAQAVRQSKRRSE